MFLTARFVRAASALGISHSQGCTHRHLSIDLILGCCSTSLEQPHDRKTATGSCQHQAHPSLCPHIPAEPDPSTGATLDSPVYLCGLVERRVILLFAFPARRRERQSRGKQSAVAGEEKGVLAWGPQAHGVPSPHCPGAGGGPRTTCPRVQMHAGPYNHGFRQEPISPRQFLTSYYWRIRPARYFSPYQRCCKILILARHGAPWAQCSTTGLQLGTNYQVTISKHY